MKNRGNFIKEIYEEAGNIKFDLTYNADDVAKQDLETRYKVVVVTILPILLSLVRAIFFLLSGFLGFFFGALLTSIFKG